MPKAAAVDFESFVDLARLLARQSIATAEPSVQADAMARLERKPLSGTAAPKVSVLVEIESSSWRVEVRAGGVVPMKVPEASGLSAPQGEQEAA
jgi:hypothetical protein